MRESIPERAATSRWRERAGWIAPVALAVLVVCSGCAMLFAFTLTARTEIEVSLLGSDWRVWQLQEKGRNGIGVSQSHRSTSASGQTCRLTRTWLISWRPALEVEPLMYEACDESDGRGTPPFANESRSIIMSVTGG